ncbi:phycobilisome linker polypeptide [Synechococcus sp. CS-602]|uniref:phycobilisome linker polypeptide n=1 Tax=Synechococcaceae TaxID=1890426 RepID=UPI0008FF3303|nr:MULTISPECIES: phycobilisome linker polypeptide [Synechococcaceae]MCT4364442.1 phycobilisome linker polypeptide [Candidatus Regnicoccus frigidus MAG-AL1]APD48341.1 photosystem I reaction center subunit XII [Synechococcus sp. SynAce01]MCT0201484.1 phycobilisome linker polypeptide [Synechococcus sp. CS-603]MCT0205991.1 phycobilisome linker polypeptide [Synechococcus sp. CS-602]MCT0244915.1 phycobilisome linker polypeptide [Synechococcus sp. CS-601]
MTFGPASFLGVERFTSIGAQEHFTGDENADKDVIIRAIYRQVLGNAYVMEEERQVVAESQFKLGRISVREFVRQLAKSDTYQSRFFDTCSRYRYIELSFKHLLGRAPDNFEELRSHSTILDEFGFQADIDSFIDSVEYQNRFGEDTVPYLHGWQTGAGKSMREFTWMFQLTRGASSSDLKGDVAGIAPKLGSAAYQNTSFPVISPSNTASSFRLASPNGIGKTRSGVGAGQEGKVFRVQVSGNQANKVQKFSRYRQSSRVYYVPFEKLSEQYQRIHAEGGKIASITPVN